MKVRRGKSRKNALTKFNFLLNNVRGIKCKKTTLERIIEEENPVLVAIVETKLEKEEKIELPGYKVTPVNRNEEGGGALLAIRNNLTNLVVSTNEYKQHGAEMVWIKLDNTKVKIKIGVIYMPQESRTNLDVLEIIYKNIEEEIEEAYTNGLKLFVYGDMNCKVGDIIKGNKSDISKGGRLLLKMAKKYKLSIVNSLSVCEGLWTRIEGEEKSVIDYVLTFEEDTDIVEEMIIDEEKLITPYHIESESRRRIYTDHCMISGRLNFSLENEQPKHTRVLGKEGWEAFRGKIEKIKISNLIDDRNIEESYKEWSKTIMKIKESCSKKVKIRRSWKVNRKLTTEKKRIARELRKNLDKTQIQILKSRKKMILEEIEEEEKKKEYARITKVVEDVQRAGGVNSTTFMDVRKKIKRKSDELPHAMIDKEGKKCDHPEEIKSVYKEWYMDLLKTKEGETNIEKGAEEVVNLMWESMEIIAKRQPPRETTTEEVQTIVNKLDTKKAKDSMNWKNNIIKEGGGEMIESLKRIFNKVDEQRTIPTDWQDMMIKAVHKKGDKMVMSNKRGLFLTNNVSKIYERILKERNSEKFKEGISEWSNGGLSSRSAVDNVLITNAIIEQNQYLGRNTYLVLTDAEKCFDKLWLRDGIIELWRSGTDIRDCCMIKKLNEKARVVVKTPVGNTDPFYLEEIVRQGSVYGGLICIASTDRVNSIGKDINTFYGPNLPLRAVIFVDDVSGSGGVTVANNVIYNCNILEEQKKFTFNNKNGKTEYMIIGKAKEEKRTITNCVKNGKIQQATEHKMLGTWYDETGCYGININKKKENLKFMISTNNYEAHPKNVGKLAVAARLNLAEIVTIASILHHVEAFHQYTQKEIQELERVQLAILIGILELPRSTPYYPLLMETGWWLMRGRIAYRKLMLFHNTINSSRKRVTKQLILIQKQEKRDTTWYSSVQREIKNYDIKLDPTTTLKSSWKKHVKQKIKEQMEIEIREKCTSMTKGRTVMGDKYEKKEYLMLGNLVDIKKIVRLRMHMSKLPANYKEGGEGICMLCEAGKGNIEHYFDCYHTERLAKVWGVEKDHLNSLEPQILKSTANFIGNVEDLLQPLMENRQ